MTHHDPKMKEVALRKTISAICAERDRALALFTKSAANLADGYALASEAAQVAHEAAGRDSHCGTSHTHLDTLR